METKIVLIVLIVVILVILARCVRVVQQSKAYVIERLGAFHTVWSVGLHFKVPFIDRVLRVADFPPQPVITKDNVTMQIDTVLYYQITDPKLFAYGVENPMNAIENLTATTLRNIIGELELDQSLTSRDIINARMRSILDEATDPWGIKVNRVELKNILPPKDIQNAMEKQMRAERERREQILQAEGQKQSQILVAEGEKESRILRADGEKQARIMEAEAEAAAILRVNEAMANSLKLLNESNPTDPVIRIKALEAFQAAANGKATKIIIPSEIQGLAGLAEGEQVIDIFSMPPQGNSGTYLFVTAGGLVKRSDCALYGARRGKNAALSLKDDDRLVRVIRLEAAADLLLVSRQAMAIRIHTDEIPVTGRVSAGVKGIALELGDSVCFAGIADEKSSLVLLSDRGYGKRIPLASIARQKRAGKGQKCFPMAKGGVNGTMIAGALLSQDPQMAFEIQQKSGVITPMCVQEIMAETRTSKGTPYVMAIMDDVVVALHTSI